MNCEGKVLVTGIIPTSIGANLHLHKELDSEGIHSDKSFINSYDKTTTKTFEIDVEVYQELEKILINIRCIRSRTKDNAIFPIR